MPELGLRSIVKGAANQIIDLAQRAVQAPSLSGQEEQVADLILAEMQALGYDEVSRDAVGNVVGLMRGQGTHVTMLHSHMDIVDPGDPAAWSHPPFAGDIADGYLWGRGASDDKASLVAQVYAPALLRQAGYRPAGDVYVVAVVAEEMGGVGTR
ncbi:MAG: M20/M25/M40 family metallo-hydrolase, partial [Chloroflexi bacterium]|nr:M20/M25/M40 family metallo-hydrolase [Chloroflexota bacterium]